MRQHRRPSIANILFVNRKIDKFSGLPHFPFYRHLCLQINISDISTQKADQYAGEQKYWGIEDWASQFDDHCYEDGNECGEHLVQRIINHSYILCASSNDTRSRCRIEPTKKTIHYNLLVINKGNLPKCRSNNRVDELQINCVWSPLRAEYKENFGESI